MKIQSMWSWQAYRGNTSGQFAVWFAIIAFPLLIATSAVIDYRKAEANRAGIKGALDTAVLAAVSNNKIDKRAKRKMAKKVFKENYVGTANLQLSVRVSDGRVEMTAAGSVPTSIGRAVGFSKVDVTETSVAEMTRENTICVLSLAPKGKGRLQFLGKTKFASPSCSVQSNSLDPQSIISETQNTPIAKAFCSAGGASGSFIPGVRGECQGADDPYKNRRVPAPGVCVPETEFNSIPVNWPYMTGYPNIVMTHDLPNNTSHSHPPEIVHTHSHQHCHGSGTCHSHNHTWHRDHHDTLTNVKRLIELDISIAEQMRLLTQYDPALITVRESDNYTGANRVLSPGTYCGGLTVDGNNVTFLPGTYIMKDGPLTFKNGATAKALDVAFILTGNEAVVTVESGSYVDVKAPARGDMAGMAFYQTPNSKPANGVGIYPDGVNLLSSGGELNVTGTLYFPTQALDILGDSVLGAKAPATSFIAYEVTFADRSEAEVSVDYRKAGLPPMLPKSDDGARLVE